MSNIYVNQLGYRPSDRKVATLSKRGVFCVIRIENEQEKIVYEAETTEAMFDDASGETVCKADFSGIKENGIYFLKDADGNKSRKFEIRDGVYDAVFYDMIRELYYQRCGCALLEQFAGKYAHDKCHMKLAKLLWDQTKTRDVTGGWHDAGDYGKYVSPAAVSIGHLLYAMLLFPDKMQLNLKIPESGSTMPDVLCECLYEINWLFKMQREDGGVFHKTTGMRHPGFMMPEEDEDQFYIFEVSSMATADFAACMALASRVYGLFDKALADRMLAAANKAWEWLANNPEYVGFQNPEGCNTGQYEDETDVDERLWAAAEMYVTTGQEQYADVIRKLMGEAIGCTDFGWTDVSGFASMAILTDENQTASDDIVSYFTKKVMKEADALLAIQSRNAYELGMVVDDYVWGSNMVVANKGILLVLAGYMTGQGKYFDAAENHLHYLLGRNAMDVSYVTGHGSNPFMHPHNRYTICDGVEEPMPGLVSGGPFKDFCDQAALGQIPKGTPPMKCYLDNIMSYSTNEITIYWNTAAVLMTAGIL